MATWEKILSKKLWKEESRLMFPAVVKNTTVDFTPEQIKATLEQFIGEIEQTVPKFSAVKINGERAYKLARKGKDFDPPTRKVKIYQLEILNYNYPELKIRCHVSSGTYIRTLAEDIGKALGTGAYLTALRRTKIKDYDVNSALPLSDFDML